MLLLLPDVDVDAWRGLVDGVDARYLCRTDSSTGQESAEAGMGGWSGGSAEEVIGLAGRLNKLLLDEAGAAGPKVNETMVVI